MPDRPPTNLRSLDDRLRNHGELTGRSFSRARGHTGPTNPMPMGGSAMCGSGCVIDSVLGCSPVRLLVTRPQDVSSIEEHGAQ